ncbi:dTDP-4-dehydrorhamnose reductase [Pontibacter sp. SGAir0037]|uniref:dTDP-4-dehydrorhamnose reductase n=1 Tax=Pontibacter sp. SGAir0037 TaxID=2571030 RepID=UPI0010CD052A|nr:dTDP-4-dehydrorhamnose reductase [Pontibacter sp. SGAir0037]QCR20988.1 dTDP-4-dehydrorhamnose reductase [Pontibacter sp. SGAir0037]
MLNIIVFGASGQLGHCLKAVAQERALQHIFFLPEENANILDIDSLDKIFEEYKPAYCINCAAYTAVDKAEDEIELARRINRDGVENLSRFCEVYDTTLIHVSTDFVFSGNSYQPLSETDEAVPISIYGLTKLEGEQVIPTYTDKFFVLRTSWLYSEYGNNFVKTMLRLGKEREQLSVIWDQVGTPTYAIDLAGCIFTIIESGSTAFGIYHYSNEGLTSWYDFAQSIFEISNTAVKVLPIRTAEYVTKAKRPAYSVMDKSKIKRALQIEIPHWRESLETCINRL